VTESFLLDLPCASRRRPPRLESFVQLRPTSDGEDIAVYIVSSGQAAKRYELKRCRSTEAMHV
jgi:hypothetical protein